MCLLSFVSLLGAKLPQFCEQVGQEGLTRLSDLSQHIRVADFTLFDEVCLVLGVNVDRVLHEELLSVLEADIAAPV